MLVTFKKIIELSYGIVSFYTVTLGSNELTEFEIFDGKDFPDHHEEIELIYNTINEMQRRGAAKVHYFKQEATAEALPVVPYALMDANKEDFGIRLYCKRVSDEIVILFNGDIKTVKDRAQDCPNVAIHFSRALKIGLRIDKALFNKDINLDEQNPFEDFEIDI